MPCLTNWVKMILCGKKMEFKCDPLKTWITYEEVIDATTSQGLIQTEEKSRDRMGGASA